MPAKDLRVFFLLSDTAQTAINKQREAHTRLERFVATARQPAHEETWHRLTPLVTVSNWEWQSPRL
jgi:hypothetical protein